MGKRRTRPKVEDKIHCERGETFIFYRGAMFAFKYRMWLFRLNPRFLLPALRKDHRKKIYINGRRRGYAEVRSGIIPRQRYQLRGRSLGVKLKNFIRNCTGLGCRKYEKGYSFLAIDKEEYIILQRVTEQGFRVCEVYWKRYDTEVGVLIFNSDLSEVQFTCGIEGGMTVLVIAAGYMVDNLIYSLAASQLTKTIKLVV